MRKFLLSKLHKVTITEANLNYQGSITIPPSLLEASGILEHEAVWVWNVSNGARFETYVIRGVDAADETSVAPIAVNGAAARLVSPCDVVIVAAFVMLSGEEARQHSPKAVFVDGRNRITSVSREQPFTV
jgi:aspartate 1-decarboxylase